MSRPSRESPKERLKLRVFMIDVCRLLTAIQTEGRNDYE